MRKRLLILIIVVLYFTGLFQIIINWNLSFLNSLLNLISPFNIFNNPYVDVLIDYKD
jgi:hypothetical protein